ncbi:hypothetical protein [Catenulispora subtropica]|uniref:Amino acid transporter n=1 Tax=Catenulispora subtropica TaxID=450798 RepID=A0ABN2SCZ8_9ACTN
MSQSLPPGGIELSPADIQALEHRWAAAWSPQQVAARLAGLDTPWCVAAGWALELFVGHGIRSHGDLEIAIPAADFAVVRDRFDSIGDYVFDGVGDGKIWPEASARVLAVTHQTWLRDAASGHYLLDVFREPHDGDTWICRHDPTIRLPYAQIIRRNGEGIPYLVPELVLLFKAKHARPKDQADFDTTVAYLNAAERRRLAELIDHAYPGHRWLASL